jgi:excisionase family DNA binding protein
MNAVPFTGVQMNRSNSPTGVQVENPKLAFRAWEVAGALGISRTAVYGLIKDGKLPATKIAGVTVVLASDLDAFLAGLKG